MKHFLLAIAFSLTLAPVAALARTDEKIVYDLSAINQSLPAQICDKTQSEQGEGEEQATVIKLSPSKIEVQSGDAAWLGGQLYGELFISSALRTDEAQVDIVMHKAARVGNQVFRDLLTAGFSDGRLAVLLSNPNAQTLALLRGETPDAPPGKNLKIEFSPSKDAPNQLRLTITNTGQTPLTLRWGNDGTPDNPAKDPLLSLSATHGAKAIALNPRPLPLSTLGSPFTLGSGQSRERLIYLDDYLVFDAAGTVRVQAHYTVQVGNPDPNGPATWNIGMDAALDVSVVRSAAQ